MNEFGINRKYKDRLFIFLFGNEEYKENTLSLYNAVNGTDYTDVNDVTFYTIGDVIYIKMKNDVAVLFDSRLSLWEHQSSFNPNMPVRGLMYFGKMYDKFIKEQGKNIYGESLVRIPTPKYCVFYNGEKELPAISKMKLSDAFMIPDESGEFEWTATMYNLLSDENAGLLNSCKVLADYCTFTGLVKSNLKSGMEINEAVDEAVKCCISNGTLETYLLRHRAEVMDMVLTEFDEEVFRKGTEEDILIKAVRNLMKNMNLSEEEAIKALGIPESEHQKYLDRLTS